MNTSTTDYAPPLTGVSAPPSLVARAEQRLCLIVHALILAALLAFIAFNSRRALTYDEPWYLESVGLIDQHGMGREFLLSLPGPAGPLYPIVHYLFRPVTGLAVPLVRFVNPLLLSGTLAVMWGIFRKLRAPQPVVSALSLACIPFIWTVTGMALTELPALAFLSGALLCLVALPEYFRRPVRMALAVGGGLLLGAAVLGRQPILLTLVAVPVLAIYQRRLVAEYAVFVLASLVLPAIAFAIWHGMVPPKTDYVGAGISLPNGIASFMYGALVVAIVAPRWFVMRPWIIVSIFVAAVAADVLVGGSTIFPMRTLAERYLPHTLLPFYGMAAFGTLMGFAAWFVAATLVRLYERRGDAPFMAFTIAACVCLAGNAKITHQFSSRYLVTILPLILIAADKFTVPNRYKAVRALAGAALGFASLYTYYHAV